MEGHADASPATGIEVSGSEASGIARPASTSIRDVAQRAGVSHQTVSRVINGHPSVREATRQRVQWAIGELGFRPNRAARALSLGTSRAVTVITSDTTLYGRAAILHGVEEAARAAGFPVGVCVLESPAPDAVAKAIERSCDPTAGGVIVIAYDLAGIQALRAIPADTPVAAALEVTDTKDRARYPSVVLDDRTAARAATRYLLDLGHRTVHYVAIPSSTRTNARTQGWRAALQERGIPAPEIRPAGWTPHSAYQASQQLAADPAVTAVLCGNDDLALGVIHAFREAGRDIPGTVSIVGFDNTPQSAYYHPPLTTVRLDFVGVGRDCFRLLHHAIDPTVPATPTVAAPAELIVRASTGPPPRRTTTLPADPDVEAPDRR